GCVKGTPGLKISAAMSAHGQRSHASGLAPSLAAAARADSLSSQAYTEAPPLFSTWTAERPERASPNTPTVLPWNEVTWIIAPSAQIQRGQPHQRQNHRDDPEPDH